MKFSTTSLLAMGAAIALVAGLGLASLGASALADPGGEPNSNAGGHSSGGSENGGGNSGGGDVGAASGNDTGVGFSSADPGSADPGSVGPWISGVIYGNTSNARPSGHGVLPSLSPGPWKCADSSDCAGPTDAGGSMGEFLAPIASDGKGNPDFANSKDPGPDFSEPNKP